MRAQQFWDPEHLIAKALEEAAKQKPSQPKPKCCVQMGFYWDDAILYAPRSRWEDAPASFFWNGPVYHVIPDLEKSLTELTKLPSSPAGQEADKAISQPARQ